MSRRVARILKRTAFALALLLPAVSPAQVDRPNILLVVADDLGWTDIGPYGSEIDTPNLDRLAQHGMLFTDFHASQSCSPTRSMLLSGTDNHIAGLGNMGELLSENQKGQPGYEGYLNNTVVSLAEVLQDNGYHTYMGGKWHLGHEEGHYPRDRGFDRDLSLLYGGASHFSDMAGLMEHESPAKYTRDGVLLEELPDTFYSSRSYTDFLISSIRENREDGKPFLAYLAFTAPHDPLHVPEEWWHRYKGTYDEGHSVLHRQRVERAIELGLVPASTPVPPVYEGVEPWESIDLEQRLSDARTMEIYAGMVTYMDYNFGRMIDFLGDIGELDNTIVIFMSDNGPNPWLSSDYPANSKGLFLDTFDNSLEAMGTRHSARAYGLGWSSASSGPLSLFKLTMAEGGIRTPLIIAGPGIQSGAKSDAFTYVWDIMPTLLEKLAIEHPDEFNGQPVEDMRGRSLKTLLIGEAESVYGEEEFIGGELANSKWMRQGDYKVTLIPKPFGNGKWGLYNLATDPGETTDLSESEPDVFKRLVNAWDDYAEDVGIVPWEPEH